MSGMSVTVNGKPVPETTGGAVRWEDVPNRHAYCDGEIRRLSAELGQAQAETRSLLARIDALVRELEASAAASAPSRKSETEIATARRLRAITYGRPAIAGAGTEHIARQLLDPASPDAWQRVADMTAELAGDGEGA